MNDKNKINFKNNMLQMVRNNGKKIRTNKNRINSNDNRLGVAIGNIIKISITLVENDNFATGLYD